jgi:hypothetical protein
MTSIHTILSRTHRDVRPGDGNLRTLWLASAASVVVTILLCIGLVNR